jgi:hypothetical protein
MSMADWYLSIFLSLLERVMRISGFLRIMTVNFLESDMFFLHRQEWLIMAMSIKMSCVANILVLGGVRNRERAICSE